ncbi:MAG: hypothetical protein U0T56_02345 [Ferruginibacter sp.]
MDVLPATLNLALLPTTTSTTNQSVCPAQLPYTWNGQTYNGAGTYSVTLTGSNGCDSVATLNLTLPLTTSTTNQSVCPTQLPYTWNGQTYNGAGTYSVTLTGSNGCDSVATLNLAILPITTSTTNLGLCPSQLPYNWNSQTINAAGTYTATLTGSNGCDSVATLILSISPASSSTVNQSICPSQLPYTWNSQTYNSAGTYSVTLTGSYRLRLHCYTQPVCITNNDQYHQPWPSVLRSCPIAGTVRPSTPQVLIPLR